MRQPKVTIRHLYRVECDTCGVIDSYQTRGWAEREATRHRDRHKQEGAR